MRYCESIYQTKRWKTREVKVGSIGIGGTNPIRIQSMTTTDTRDVKATIEQIIRLADRGCDIVRMSVQGKKEAKACEAIKNTLIQKGYSIPIVADIHFYPPAAMLVVDFVDKVRVNPGNFVDRRATFKTAKYDDASYQAEQLRIDEIFGPLVEKCIKLKRAMRIGTNHGSLSDRIMSRYGDTPLGMVESALEFARVCRKLGYHDLIFSMKSSHPLIMIQAYRLLVAEMMKLGWNYPLHLGVTEAGHGEDGRVKSAIGIGSLLLDGLGDTIRVSLTEDPWKEIDPCKQLIDTAEHYLRKTGIPFIETNRKILETKRRSTYQDDLLHRDGSVILNLTDSHPYLGKNERKVDGVYLETIDSDADLNLFKKEKIAILTKSPNIKGTLFVKDLKDLDSKADVVYIKDGNPTHWNRLAHYPVRFILLEMSTSTLHQGRYFFEWLQASKLPIPVILVGNYLVSKEETLVIRASAELGSLLADGYGEGVLLRTNQSSKKNHLLSFSMLQGSRMRLSKTEFIACPGCGRTLFDLQEVSKRIQAKTSHLPGVKIAIMGCVVNGPGEMADADFGYVGSRTGKVDLYFGKACVERNIDFADADERLIQLIKSHHRWVEPDEVIQNLSEVNSSVNDKTF